MGIYFIVLFTLQNFPRGFLTATNHTMRRSQRLTTSNSDSILDSTKRTVLEVAKLNKYTICEICGERRQDISKHYKSMHPEAPKQPKSKRRTKKEIETDYYNLELDLIDDLNEKGESTIADILYARAEWNNRSEEDKKRHLEVLLKGIFSIDLLFRRIG